MSSRNKHNKHFHNENKPKQTKIPEVEIRRIVEPRPNCSICGEPIESIIEAISESEGTYSHFDCVLDKIKKEYNVGQNEQVSYVGQGNFAVFRQDSEGKFVIREKIAYESTASFDAMKKLVEDNRE